MDARFSHFEILTGAGALFLCLIFVCVFNEASAIESDVGTRVGDLVRQENLFWTSVEARGQEVVLTGAAPGHEEKLRAGQLAEETWGVTSVDNQILVIGEAGTCQTKLDGYLEDQRVTFKSGKADIAPESFPVLRLLASVLRNCGTHIEIAGHTDAAGDAKVNLKLSERRADAVQKHLVKSGVDAKYLRAVGYGETQPISGDSSKESRRKNRRIEFRVLGGAA